MKPEPGNHLKYKVVLPPPPPPQLIIKLHLHHRLKQHFHQTTRTIIKEDTHRTSYVMYTEPPTINLDDKFKLFFSLNGGTTS